MMLCLAPCKLIPPNDTIIRYENIAQSLAVLKAQSLRSVIKGVHICNLTE